MLKKYVFDHRAFDAECTEARCSVREITLYICSSGMVVRMKRSKLTWFVVIPDRYSQCTYDWALIRVRISPMRIMLALYSSVHTTWIGRLTDQLTDVFR